MKYLHPIVFVMLIAASTFVYAEENIENVLPAGIYQFNTVLSIGDREIPRISSSEVEVFYKEGIGKCQDS
jgi:hypothetical protein